jgi:hypothetical protein
LREHGKRRDLTIGGDAEQVIPGRIYHKALARQGQDGKGIAL